jgi:hypothetical protein
MKIARLFRFWRTNVWCRLVFFSAKYDTSAPATPNIAPEAPALTRHGFQATLTRLAASPLATYITPNALRPIRGSSVLPRFQRHHMLKAMWMMPKCTNVLVNKRHHCPLRVSGPKSAPHLRASRMPGSAHEAPDNPIARYASTFATIIVKVTTGRGVAKRESGAGDCPTTCDTAVLAVSACFFAFRQSEHSVAGFGPIEKPLNFLPQVGQTGTKSLLRCLGNEIGDRKSASKLTCVQV